MPDSEEIVGLHGEFRDVVVDADGRVTYDSGWHHNAIVDDFRRLLAGFARGNPTTSSGIQGILVGAGNPTWDTAGTPSPATNQAALVDANPFLLKLPPPPFPAGSSITFDYLDPTTNAVSPSPQRKLQVVVTLGANVPAWPDANHSSATLREFGLVGVLNGTQVLLNYRTHPAIARDPFSSLIRTIWLTF
jgi:hypothetical protein